MPQVEARSGKQERKQGPPATLKPLLKLVAGLVTKMKPACADSHALSKYWAAITTLRISEPSEHVVAISSINANVTAGQILNYMKKHSTCAVQ
jgi:hypothetical protein